MSHPGGKPISWILKFHCANIQFLGLNSPFEKVTRPHKVSRSNSSFHLRSSFVFLTRQTMSYSDEVNLIKTKILLTLKSFSRSFPTRAKLFINNGIQCHKFGWVLSIFAEYCKSRERSNFFPWWGWLNLYYNKVQNLANLWIHLNCENNLAGKFIMNSTEFKCV